MDRSESEKLLEKYSKKNLPGGRLPTSQECMNAIEHPENVDPKMRDYLDQRPEYEKYLRSLLDLEKKIKER